MQKNIGKTQGPSIKKQLLSKRSFLIESGDHFAFDKSVKKYPNLRTLS